ncbi:MAG TPA: zf-HC2 domain-containing protein [Bryobacteraceae bacterium]|nr:zf-HC2 domain-containing protein [Bryobacteraceae bacterium]
MTCADLEYLLCDYIDGSLPAEQRKTVELHLAVCEGCAELARDSAGLLQFLERVPVVEPPPSLVTRILHQTPSNQPVTVKAKSAFGKLIGRAFAPILQPRMVMGMAMTILSFAMLGRFAGIEARQLRPADLSPARILEATEDRMHRAWSRTVKYYESLRIVYEVQSRLRELTDVDEEELNPKQEPKPLPPER